MISLSTVRVSYGQAAELHARSFTRWFGETFLQQLSASLLAASSPFLLFGPALRPITLLAAWKISEFNQRYWVIIITKGDRPFFLGYRSEINQAEYREFSAVLTSAGQNGELKKDLVIEHHCRALGAKIPRVISHYGRKDLPTIFDCQHISMMFFFQS
jgi:hypothetical protein